MVSVQDRRGVSKLGKSKSFYLELNVRNVDKIRVKEHLRKNMEPAFTSFGLLT